MSVQYGEGAKEAATPEQIASILKIDAIIRRATPDITMRAEVSEGPNGVIHLYVGKPGHEHIRHWIERDGLIQLTEEDELDIGDWAEVIKSQR